DPVPAARSLYARRELERLRSARRRERVADEPLRARDHFGLARASVRRAPVERQATRGLVRARRPRPRENRAPEHEPQAADTHEAGIIASPSKNGSSLFSLSIWRAAGALPLLKLIIAFNFSSFYL